MIHEQKQIFKGKEEKKIQGKNVLKKNEVFNETVYFFESAISKFNC